MGIVRHIDEIKRKISGTPFSVQVFFYACFWLFLLCIFPVCCLCGWCVYANIELVVGTDYALGYTNRAFSRVETGMHAEEVLELLGEPLICGEWKNDPYWVYFSDGTKVLRSCDNNYYISGENNTTFVEKLKSLLFSNKKSLSSYGGVIEMEQTFINYWQYSKSWKENGNFKIKTILIDKDSNTVAAKISSYYWD